MTYYTQPDLLPAPDDGTQPALALSAYRALADAVQAALTGLRARTDDIFTRLGVLEAQFGAVGGQALIDAAVNPATIETSLGQVLGASAFNGNPAVQEGTVTAVMVDGPRLRVYHTFSGGGQRQLNFIAVGTP
jgi:hypothetical protein